jgi:hypothetical protein
MNLECVSTIFFAHQILSFMFISFDSIIYLAKYVCLWEFYDIIAPICVKTYPLVDFEFLVSDIQLRLLYLSSTTRYAV